jgi:hypothetical protein
VKTVLTSEEVYLANNLLKGRAMRRAKRAKRMSTLVTFAFVLLAASASDAVEVAFVEMRTADGRVLQLEKNGQFAHVAISYKGLWLHAHPFYGVEAVTSERLARVGVIKAVVKVSEHDSLDDEEVARFLGKPYDRSYSWSDEKIYCSELVGKLLRLKPKPMDFSAEAWPAQYRKLNGAPGLSPDGVYRTLIEEHN